jgi:hypothetical protein
MGDSGEQDRIDMGTSFERLESLTDNSTERAPFIKPSVISLSPLCKILTGNYWIQGTREGETGDRKA